jgi:hypothetical protein
MLIAEQWKISSLRATRNDGLPERNAAQCHENNALSNDKTQ